MGNALIIKWTGKEFDLKDGDHVRVTGAYEPDMKEHARYTERYQVYRELYPRMKDLLHKM